jgi:hypothetical protein
VDLEAFELVILRRPPDAPAYDEDTLERIQREHLAYHESLRLSGHVLTNGPVIDQPDESMRGVGLLPNRVPRGGTTARRTGSRGPGRTPERRGHVVVVSAGHDGPPRQPRLDGRVLAPGEAASVTHYDPFDDEMHADPFPTYERMRDDVHLPVELRPSVSLA